MRFRAGFVANIVVLLLAAGGCGRLAPKVSPAGYLPPAGMPLENPLPLPPVPREFVMDQVSDEIDNYFRIAREERLRLVDNVLTEGWIETHPQIGSTLLEPWRRDSPAGFERVQATLQTIRRLARVRVIPMGDGYLVDVQVFKEIEDLTQPERSTVSGQVIRTDNTLDSDLVEEEFVQRNRGWIPLGRDWTLEQKILQNIQSRIGSAVQDGLRHH